MKRKDSSTGHQGSPSKKSDDARAKRPNKIGIADDPNPSEGSSNSLRHMQRLLNEAWAQAQQRENKTESNIAECSGVQEDPILEEQAKFSSKEKWTCCHFSSDGNMLACAGDEKKVMICNTEIARLVESYEEHNSFITDVRFKPNSATFATSSYDGTVKIFDIAKLTKEFRSHTILRHNGRVMSLDFHPRKTDILCSCCHNRELRLWNINPVACTCSFEGASKQVRFNPNGQLLATAIGNSINLVDVETCKIVTNLKGHAKDIQSLCWEASGELLASVSEDSARVWASTSSMNVVQELHSEDGNKFHSCIFHHSNSKVLIVGGYQSLELWHPIADKKMGSFPAHEGLIMGLAGSPASKLIASVSDDKYVKLWK